MDSSGNRQLLPRQLFVRCAILFVISIGLATSCIVECKRFDYNQQHVKDIWAFLFFFNLQGLNLLLTGLGYTSVLFRNNLILSQKRWFYPVISSAVCCLRSAWIGITAFTTHPLPLPYIFLTWLCACWQGSSSIVQYKHFERSLAGGARLAIYKRE